MALYTFSFESTDSADTTSIEILSAAVFKSETLFRPTSRPHEVKIQHLHLSEKSFSVTRNTGDGTSFTFDFIIDSSDPSVPIRVSTNAGGGSQKFKSPFTEVTLGPRDTKQEQFQFAPPRPSILDYERTLERTSQELE